MRKTPVIGSHKKTTAFDETAEKMILFGGHKYNLFSRNDMHRLARDATGYPESAYSGCDGEDVITVIDLNSKDSFGYKLYINIVYTLTSFVL